MDYFAAASLGLVSPGVATEGVTPFFSEKPDDLFLVITVFSVLFIFSSKTDDLF